MFDTMMIARRIKQARIEKNMTQLQLADAMGVSYQAVSNWERGNSMPDISKLADLCSTLDITVNELLGMEEKTTAAVTKAMEKEEMTVEELVEVAPMLPPEEVKERVEESVRKWNEENDKIVEKRNQRLAEMSRRLTLRFGGKQSTEENKAPAGKHKKKIDLSAVAELAPFLDGEYLNSLVLDADLSDLDGLDDLAPFLSKETLNTIAARADVDDLDVLVDIAPFLKKQTIENLIKRCIEEGEGDMIEEFAPFAAKEFLDELVDTLIAQKADFEDMDWYISDLYPFLSKSALLKLAKYLLEQGQNDPLDDVKDYL